MLVPKGTVFCGKPYMACHFVTVKKLSVCPVTWQLTIVYDEETRISVGYSSGDFRASVCTLLNAFPFDMCFYILAVFILSWSKSWFIVLDLETGYNVDIPLQISNLLEVSKLWLILTKYCSFVKLFVIFCTLEKEPLSLTLILDQVVFAWRTTYQTIDKEPLLLTLILDQVVFAWKTTY